MGCGPSSTADSKSGDKAGQEQGFTDLSNQDNGLSTYLPTNGPLTAKDYKSRLVSSEGVQTLHFPTSGYTVRYAYVTQRGYYPDAVDKANQDSLCVHSMFGGDPEQALFGVFDGHGEYGTQCSQFAKDKVGKDSLSVPSNHQGGTSSDCIRAHACIWIHS